MKCVILAPDFFRKLIKNVEEGHFSEILVQEKNVLCVMYMKISISVSE